MNRNQGRVVGEILASTTKTGQRSNSEYDINLTLGKSGVINGSVRLGHYENVAAVQFLRIGTPALRRHGLGTRLMQAFVAQSVDMGAVELQSNCVSQDALYMRAKLFGTHLLEFYDDETGCTLPIDFEQALLITEDIDNRHTHIEDYKTWGEHLGVSVDLSLIDVSGWERPRITTNEIELR